MEYQINGIDGVYEEEKLVLVVLQDYCSKNEYTFNELKEIFPDEVQDDKDIYLQIGPGKLNDKKKACIHLNEFYKLLIYTRTNTKLKYTFNPPLNKKNDKSNNRFQLL